MFKFEFDLPYTSGLLVTYLQFPFWLDIFGVLSKNKNITHENDYLGTQHQ